MEEVKQVLCSNCSKPQDAEKVHLHEAYCLRNFRKCPDCNDFIDKRELETHKQEKHTKQQCKYCSQGFLPKELEVHFKNCIRKPQMCLYCKLDVDGTDFTEHLQSCGSRTSECLLCGKSIILFNYDEHMNTCVGPVEQPYQKQFPSHQQAFKPKPGVKQPEIKPYQPHTTNVSTAKVQIGGNTQNKPIEKSQQDKEDEEFARKLQSATENNDIEELKKLQEEEDERLARRMNQDFSPKNKTVQAAQKSQQKQSYDDYDYDYEEDQEQQQDYQDDMNYQEELRQAQQQQQGINNPLVFPKYEKTKEQKEMEELGEFIDNDPELQQAILQSQMMNK